MLDVTKMLYIDHLYVQVYINIEQVCKKIIQVVKEREIDGGVTKNEVCVILREKYGGSRSTYWKGFERLLGSDSTDEIELRLIPPNKQLEKLFPTDKNKKIEEFQKKKICRKTN